MDHLTRRRTASLVDHRAVYDMRTMTDRPELQRIRKRDPRGDGDRDPRDVEYVDDRPKVVDPPPGTPRPKWWRVPPIPTS